MNLLHLRRLDVHLVTFIKRHPLAILVIALLFICGSVAIASTNVQWVVDGGAVAKSTNPHLIPDHMDPKSQALSEEINRIKVEINEGVEEVGETIHSVAFHGVNMQSQPVLDYTTGTSN